MFREQLTRTKNPTVIHVPVFYSGAALRSRRASAEVALRDAAAALAAETLRSLPSEGFSSARRKEIPETLWSPPSEGPSSARDSRPSDARAKERALSEATADLEAAERDRDAAVRHSARVLGDEGEDDAVREEAAAWEAALQRARRESQGEL